MKKLKKNAPEMEPILCMISTSVASRKGWSAHVPSLQMASSWSGIVNIVKGHAALKRELKNGEEVADGT